MKYSTCLGRRIWAGAEWTDYSTETGNLQRLYLWWVSAISCFWLDILLGSASAERWAALLSPYHACPPVTLGPSVHSLLC